MKCNLNVVRDENVDLLVTFASMQFDAVKKKKRTSDTKLDPITRNAIMRPH
jgi:hypothetical protein